MEDNKIIELFWTRNEEAIRETSSKYGKLCFGIAGSILSSREDCEECVNDTYLGVWNAIPVQRPNRFSVFITKITRNLALKKCEYNSAAKRSAAAVTAFEELEDCVSGKESVESEVENRRIERAISRFLSKQSREKRNIFVWRYWYFASLDDICAHTGFSSGKVKSILFNMRKKLRAYLEGEGIEV